VRAERPLRAHRKQYRYDSDGNTRVTINPTGMTEHDGLNRLVDTILPNPQTGLPTGPGTVNTLSQSENRLGRGGQSPFVPRPSRRRCPAQKGTVPGGSNLLSVTDPDYNITRYGYDAENERTSQQVTIHDASGNPVSATTTWPWRPSWFHESDLDSPLQSSPLSARVSILIIRPL
jgi:YD repeat-containing protein